MRGVNINNILVTSLTILTLLFYVPQACMVPVSENGDTIQPNTHIDANNKQKINPVNNYTTIDTQYGKLHIENETLKRLGNDKIMEKFTEFKKLQNMARKDENLSGKDSYSTISYFNYSTNTLNAVPASGISPLSMIWNLERTYFNDSSANANRPTLIWGHVEVQPISSGSTQHWDGAYLEREIMLNNYDCIEFIVQYNGDFCIIHSMIAVRGFAPRIIW